MAQTLLAARRTAGEPVTPELIGATADQILAILPGAHATDARRQLIQELETRFNVWIGDARTLADDRDHVAWLTARKDGIDWRHWQRYRSFLDQSMSNLAADRLDDITSDILGRVEDPQRKGRWSRRGLVVGHVQSGKTANYIGLITKAADAGYKVIVVLAGMHRNLRAQTQIRLDEGFLGFDSGARREGSGAINAVGVGMIDPGLRPNTITTRQDDGDFNLAVARNFNIAPGGTPLLFVIKKNGSVLKNLLDWVRSTATTKDAETGRPLVVDVPLLVIDDEADQSSIDTGRLTRLSSGEFDPEYDPKPINSRIRALLQCFAKNASIGYTATPFANIYIHEEAETEEEGEDLFPRSFIMNLPAPSNYRGPSQLFPSLTSVEDHDTAASSKRARKAVIRTIVDHVEDLVASPQVGWMPPHKRTHVPRFEGRDELPPSLIEAVEAFVLSCAARTARGQGRQHKSMLVHVTRFTDVQKAVYSQVVRARDDLRARWRNGDTALRAELELLWNSDFVPVSAESTEEGAIAHAWADVEPHVWPVLESITVKEINGTSADVLAYEEHSEIGLNVIVIGGDKLSRGLTLSGLSVSYFLRSSRMYDTLMQMGRWFGYRPAYADLCRLYVTSELEDWFRVIAAASEELREQFDHMVAVGMSPRDYGLRVKSHPALLVTSAVKCRESVTLRLSYAATVSETVTFLSGQRPANETALRSLLAALGAPLAEVVAAATFPHKPGNATVMWSDVAGDRIETFLRSYLTPPGAYRVNGLLMAKYVAAQRAKDELTRWTVALIGPKGGVEAEIGGQKVALTERAPEGGADDNVYRIGRLLSPTDEALDLDTRQYVAAVSETQREYDADPAASRRKQRPDSPSGPRLRETRPAARGLLILYALLPENAPELDGRKIPYLGVGVSFPGSRNATGVEYRVNNVYLENDVLVDS
jgi:hypothetical protein